MSKLENIMTFIAVVEQNSFVAAAKKQGISTAAVSRKITNLEAALGTELLHRTTRSLTLTEVGTLYYEQCKSALEGLAMAEAVIASSQQEPMGTLNITCAPYFAQQYLVPILPEFMANYPKLFINLELAERFPDLVQEKIDVLLGVSFEGPPELVRRRIGVTRYVLCAAPKYLEKYGVPKTPADLTKHHYITHTMRKPANAIPYKNAKMIYVEPTLWLNDTGAMRECAIQGLGIVRLHDYMVANALQEKKLIEILPDFQEPELPVFLYYQPSRYLQPKIRRFIDFYLQKVCRG